jgi:signal transduction histidine kinase
VYQPEYLVIALSTLGLLLRTQVSYFREAYHRATAREKELRTLRASEVQARREAEEAARVKSRFLAHVSHEVRTPLNAISGTASMLQQTALTPEQKEYVDVLATGTETLQAILGDILDYVHIEAGKIALERRPVNVAGAIADALKLLQSQADARGLQLTMTIDGDVPPTITTDPIRLRQVLLNLLTNAIKFTAAGAVHVEVTRLRGENKALLQIAVSDTGCGIALRDQVDLFEPFVQGARNNANRDGVGLGLAICKELVTLMGGEIWLQSKRGYGSTFTFTLPMTG